MQLAEDSKVRPIENFSSLEISSWCRDYLRYNKYPANLLERFAIGFYQINQVTDWPDPQNKAEALMSATLHFLMVAEMLDLTVELNLDWETQPINYQSLLLKLSKLQQQIFYKHKATVKSVDGKVYQRASRFKVGIAGCLLVEIIHLLISAVPKDYRRDGLYHASKIMSGAL